MRESKLDRKLQALNKNIQAIDIRLQNSIQVAEQWLTALPSTPGDVGSDVTDMKQRLQFVGSVATTTTFSQQSSVCSTVKNAPSVYQTIPHLSTPSPACYPYPSAPSRQTSCQSQSVLQVTCNMPVPPPSHIPIAHSTSPGMAQPSNNPVAQSTSQGMSQAGGYQNQRSGSSVNQGSANLNSVKQSSVNVDCKPQTLKKPENIAPKFPVYDIGDSFHTFITAFEAVLKHYGMMDEAVLRLPECLSQSVLSLYLSSPQRVRSSYTESVAVLRQFWPALPGVSNFDDLNYNYGLPLLKQGHDSIGKFATKVCAVATSIAKGDAKRFDRLAKYMLWRGMSADAHLWMDKCYDDNFTFVEFYTLCRRLSLNLNVEFTSTPKVRFDLPSTPHVLAAEVGSSSNDEGTVRSPQRQSPSSNQYAFPKGSESPNWRERSSSQTQCSGSMSPNWREKNYSLFKPEPGSMTSAIQNGSSQCSSSISPSRNKTYSQCYGCREYGHHRYECPCRNISPPRSPGWNYSPSRARYPRPGERF